MYRYKNLHHLPVTMVKTLHYLSSSVVSNVKMLEIDLKAGKAAIYSCDWFAQITRRGQHCMHQQGLVGPIKGGLNVGC